MKRLAYVLFFTVSLGMLVSCSSPEEKAADYIESAKLLFEQDKLEKAALEYRNALQINQNLTDAWYGLALIHEKNQEWSKLYTALNKIRELNPKHLDARVKLGQILLASNQLDEALLDAREILEMAPDDGRAHALMAAVQFKLNNFDGARVEIDSALNLDPDNQDAQLILARIYISEQNYQQAHRVLDPAIKKHPDVASLYFMKIWAYQGMKNLTGIESVYKALVKQFPENLDYRHLLAKFYSVSQEFDKAEKILQGIVASHPDNIQQKLRLVGFTNQFRSFEAAEKLLNNYIQKDGDEHAYQFALGEIYEHQKKLDKARIIYQSIINANDVQTGGLEARNRLALLEINNRNRDKAIKLIEQVLATDKHNEKSLLMQAGYRMADKRFDDAIIDLRTVLGNNPDSTKALGLLAKSYEAIGSNELALESYRKAYQISPTHPALVNQLANHYIRNKKINRANEVLERSFNRGNRNLASLKLLTQVKLSLKDWESAEKFAKLLQKRDGQEALSQQLLGVAYLGQQQYDESIDAFKKAHELSPSASQPVAALVRTYVKSGELEKAKNFLNSVLTVDANNVTAYTLLGQLSLYQKQPEQAEQYFRKSVEINPKYTNGYRNLAQIHLKANQPDKAVAILMEGLDVLPDSSVLNLKLASIYITQRAYAEAIEVYQALLEKNTEHIIAKNNLASLLIDHSTDKASLDEAVEIARELRDSKIPQFRDTYAWASVKANINIEEAILVLESIVRESNDTAIYNYHLGEAYFKKGDTSKAIHYLENAIKYSKADTDISDKASQTLQQIGQ